MTDTPENTPAKPENADRIAKVMARAGVASRREAERMIIEGRVTVNGRKIDSPALDVLPSDQITVDGKKLDEKQDTRLWLYYKPAGLVTSESDEKGRQTIFDALPRELPRVMTVGRLDLNSEGLLLLTNDGELKRRLELPATGWLRRYRVRVNGNPSDLTFAPLRRGVTIDGEEFAPMEIRLDSQQGANAWLTVGIREGKNREIRRAMAHVALQVNRLIRIGYGPFKLTGLEKNEVTEVKRRVLRDQLGGLLTGEVEEKDREMRPRGAEAPRKPRSFGSDRPERGDGGPRRFSSDGPRRDGDRDDRPFRKSFGTGPRPERGDGGPRRFASDGPRRDGDRDDKPFRKNFGSGPRPERGDGEGRPQRRFGGKPGFDGRDGDKPGRGPGRGGFGGPRGDRDGNRGEGRDFGPRGDRDGPRKDRKDFAPRGDGQGKPGGFRARPAGEGGKPGGFRGRPAGEDGGKPGGRPFGKPGQGKFGGSKSGGGKFGGPRSGGPKPEGGRSSGPKSGGGKPGGRPFGGPGGNRPRGPKPQ